MVSYVLRTGDRGNSSPETRARISDAVRKLGYRTDFAARVLRTGKSRSIGVVLPRINQGYLHNLMVELEVSFLQYGYVLFYTFFDLSYNDFSEALARMTAMNVEAVITPGFAEDIPDIPVPLVIWGNNRDGHDCVFPDKAGFGADVISRLYEFGHRKIAIAGILKDIRYQAMNERLEALGIAGDAVFFNCKVSDAGAVSVIREIAEMKARPTVVVFHSDEMAISGISEAHRLGIKVPQELSVVGYDNLALGTSVVPMLTTYDPCYKEMADKLADVTIRRLEHCDEPIQQIAVNIKFVERKSLFDISSRDKIL